MKMGMRLISFLCVFQVLVDADDVIFDWTISYSQQSLLGVSKQVIAINGQFPGPLLNATTNDVVIITIHNNLTDPFLMTWLVTGNCTLHHTQLNRNYRNGVQLRKRSWQDGVLGTNCPIQPGESWTYNFLIKDQIGSFFYFPSLFLHKSAGGYGPIRINNRQPVPLPFTQPYQDIDLLIGDWYNTDNRELRSLLDRGSALPMPDGILINGQDPRSVVFRFQPGVAYRFRISNVGLKMSLNLNIQDHLLQLVETEGTYTVQQTFTSLDIHVGQSYSVLVTSKNEIDHKMTNSSYYMVVSSRFTFPELVGVSTIEYPDSGGPQGDPVSLRPFRFDYTNSINQFSRVRMDLEVGAARSNPQGSYHYGQIDINQTIVLENGVMLDGNKIRYTVNGVSFVYPDTPLKLADYYLIKDIFNPNLFQNKPGDEVPIMGTSVLDVASPQFLHVVFYNPLPDLQTWHLDGYNFFVVGIGNGKWDESEMYGYNMVDGISRSTVEVYPFSWTAVVFGADNYGMWNMRSGDAEKRYLGQELYMRVRGSGDKDPKAVSVRDESPIPDNVLKCGRATFLF